MGITKTQQLALFSLLSLPSSFILFWLELSFLEYTFSHLWKFGSSIPAFRALAS